MSKKIQHKNTFCSSRSIASKLDTCPQNQICIGFPIENIQGFHENISFWELVPNFEAIDLLEEKMFLFWIFFEIMSQRYCPGNNQNIYDNGLKNNLNPALQYFLSDFQDGVYSLRFRGREVSNEYQT